MLAQWKIRPPISSVCNFMDVNPTPTANLLPSSLMRFVEIYQLFFLSVHFCRSVVVWFNPLRNSKNQRQYPGFPETRHSQIHIRKIQNLYCCSSIFSIVAYLGKRPKVCVFIYCASGSIHKALWNLLLLPPFDWQNTGKLSLNQQKQRQNVKRTISENMNTTSVLNLSQVALFPGPNCRTQSEKNRNKKPWSETDMPISEAVRPPRGSAALPTINGSPEEVQSFSERHDFAFRVRQAGGLFYHIWCVKVCASKVEGLTEYKNITSEHQVWHKFWTLERKKKKFFFLNIPKVESLILIPFYTKYTVMEAFCLCVCVCVIILTNVENIASKRNQTPQLKLISAPVLSDTGSFMHFYTSRDCPKNWIYCKCK